MTATAIEPELWVDRAEEAVDFYAAAFGANTVMRVGDGDDVVVRLEIGRARFWVAAASSARARFSPLAIEGRTSRTLLVVDDPDALVSRAVGAGAALTGPVGEEHGWRVGRIVDPYGHEWEIGRPSGAA